MFFPLERKNFRLSAFREIRLFAHVLIFFVRNHFSKTPGISISPDSCYTLLPETPTKKGRFTLKQIDFENGKITDNILKAALPMLVAQILSLLYNIVDRIYTCTYPGYRLQRLLERSDSVFRSL